MKVIGIDDSNGVVYLRVDKLEDENSCKKLAKTTANLFINIIDKVQVYEENEKWKSLLLVSERGFAVNICVG